MESGLENIKAVLGSEAQSGFSDSIIEDTLWDCYFDVDQSINWLLSACVGEIGYCSVFDVVLVEQSRQNAAKERKGEPSFTLAFHFLSWICLRTLASVYHPFTFILICEPSVCIRAVDERRCMSPCFIPEYLRHEDRIC